MKEVIYLNDHRELVEHTTGVGEVETAPLRAQCVERQAPFDEEIFASPLGADTDFDRVLGVPMGEIIDLPAILEEKKRQKELQDQYEVEQLRSQLRWVLNKIHAKNITYEKEESEDDETTVDETTLSGGWFSKILGWNRDDIDA
jgi:hypothetical protein